MVFGLTTTRTCAVTVGAKDVVVTVDKSLDDAVGDLLVAIVLGSAGLDLEVLAVSLPDENPVGHALFGSSGIV